jgi:hypothetical protein
MLTGMELDKRPDLSSGFVPFLGNSGVNLTSLGSTASPTLPQAEIAYNVKSLGDRPTIAAWKPINTPRPIMSDYATKAENGGYIWTAQDQAKYDAAYDIYEANLALDNKNRVIYEANLDKYQTAIGNWNNAVGGIYGTPTAVKKPSSLLQSQGLGYQGLSGMNF